MGSSPTSNPPEVLPPQSNYAPQPRPRRRWASAPATYLLVGINCAVYVAMALRGVSMWSPTVDQLMNWGADRAGNVLVYGEWWRIVTAMFVHAGFIHIATNMWCLWNLGLLAEPLMGSVGLLAVYILTGAAGNLLSTLSSSYSDWMKYHDVGVFPAGAGASGAVFGIAGALIILLKSRRLPIPEYELKRLRKSVIYFAAINLVIGLSVNIGSRLTGVAIDNPAHIGGCLCGLLFAIPMVPRIGSPRAVFLTRIRLTIAATVLLLVLFGFYLAQLPRG